MSDVRKRILIVDDDADVCLSLKLALEIEGFDVQTARHGREALANASPVDLLITDLFMPEADGFETIEGFRKLHPATRIIVVSGGAKQVKADYMLVARVLGVDATFQKPVSPSVLSETIRTLLGTDRQ
ncbi:MAG TPA: response regulator [Burkholderiales bacterium]|nr:response regulator [Burkholderiales bacterium]